MDAVSLLLSDCHGHVIGLNQPMAIAMPNLLSRDNCDTEALSQESLVRCGNSMKLFGNNVSFAYTHVFSAHAESRPLLLLESHWVCITTIGCPTGNGKLSDSVCVLQSSG